MLVSKPRDGVTKEGTMIYFARQHDCEACGLKASRPARFLASIIHAARREERVAVIVDRN
jgi:hypothetical protein